MWGVASPQCAYYFCCLALIIAKMSSAFPLDSAVGFGASCFVSATGCAFTSAAGAGVSAFGVTGSPVLDDKPAGLKYEPNLCQLLNFLLWLMTAFVPS